MASHDEGIIDRWPSATKQKKNCGHTPTQSLNMTVESFKFRRKRPQVDLFVIDGSDFIAEIQAM